MFTYINLVNAFNEVTIHRDSYNIFLFPKIAWQNENSYWMFSSNTEHK